VGVVREGSKWKFHVKDNGMGVDPRYSDRIFQIFQRLEVSQDRQGTGIGLASCKKIVDYHKGEIWVESEPGQGSTFFFTIPDKMDTTA
jgi:two-component system, chemotaxis family, sensor kinase Cph1